jgi:hypothetical protein
MKKFLKKILPVSWLNYYRSITIPKQKSQFHGKDLKTTFTEIYHSNLWKGKESLSGTGSDTAQTQVLIEELGNLLSLYDIKSILDVPCGDFNWMNRVKLAGATYVGGDIVNELIQANMESYKDNSNVRFDIIDIIKDELPKADLLFCRDCLVHLSYKEIFKAILNIKKSKSTYLLTTTFTNHPINYNITTGDWRTLNLERAPFNFPKPIHIINENCTEGNGEYKDKSLFLWEIKNLPLPPKDLFL